MEADRYLGDPALGFADARRRPRFKMQTEILVYPRDCPVVRGYTIDISESGVSAMLKMEVPIGEVMRLAFTVPLGVIEVHAVARQKNAFRYGFQFLESLPAQDLIARTCRELAIEQAVHTQTRS